MSTPKEVELINSPYAKLLGKVAIGAFIVAGTIYKIDQKADDISNRIVKKIDEHIIADGYEKKELSARIAILEKQIAVMQDEAKDYFKNEFIKPEAPRLKDEHE